MKTSLKMLFTLSLILVIALPVAAGGGGLVDLLVGNLGVTPQQAGGGAGAIFGVAKDNMSGDDFSKVTASMPEVPSLMDAAPQRKAASSGLVGQATSMLGGKGGNLGNLGALADTFSSLGMDADMAGKFIPIVLEYAQSKGGDVVSGLLKSALQ